jgi:acetoacetate decarboxylase
MKQEDVLKQLTTPIGAPAFPRGPFRFNNRDYLNILHRTDINALRAVVPEPLEIDDPLVRWEIMRMPDTSALGDYTECGQVIQVRFDQEKGEYLHAMYLARLELYAHALAPMADFPVREIVGVSHILTDLTLARAKPCYDYLARAG